MTGALSHIRVLDLSRILAGPWATQVLADLGAEVIKVERPGTGDDTRQWGPPYVTDAEGNQVEAAYFMAANRGKRSVCLDIAHPEGQALVRDLARHCDVVVENFKVGGLAKYGLDYPGLKAVKPDLIYCSITGFGQDGPYADRAGYDFLIQAMGGLMSITGEADGPPLKVGVALADVLTGLYAVIGIQAALAHRERSGEGQHIDLSLLDVQAASLANQAMNYLATGSAPGRLGNAHPNIVPYQAFAAADGHLILTIGNDGQFRRFCGIAGRPDLADDPRFATNPARVANRDTLVPLLEGIIHEKPLDWWATELEAAGVPGGPINTIDRVFEDPQIRARGMRVNLPHGSGGSVPGIGSPLKMSGTPVTYQKAPPQLGEDTRAVLGGLLGLGDDEIDRLAREGVI